nr:aldose 1-epimerase [uncultured Sediminibacterium sp.]
MAFSIREEGLSNDKKIILCDETLGTTAEIFCFGALLNAFTAQKEGLSYNIIDGFVDVANARLEMNNGFKSAKLSPFVCRMRDGQYSFEQQNFKIEGFYLNGHAIHGLLCHADFTITEKGANGEKAWVCLSYHYKGTDKGFPFEYRLAITWTLYANNYLTVTTEATNLHTNRIPFTDGWHPYFTVGESIDTATLQFNTAKKLVFDADLLPTGEEEQDGRFLNGTLLAGIELDNCYALSQNESVTCILKNSNIMISIEPDSTYPYLQVYTPPHRKSIAIENLTAAPDAFNNKIGLKYLQPGESINCTTGYRITLL